MNIEYEATFINIDKNGMRAKLKKAYQENKRELWNLDSVEITIDEWPFLEPILEIEGKSEKAVKTACKKLELNYSEALKKPMSLEKFKDCGGKIISRIELPENGFLKPIGTAYVLGKYRKVIDSEILCEKKLKNWWKQFK